MKANEAAMGRPPLAVIYAEGSGRVCAPPRLTGPSVATFRALVEQVCALGADRQVVLDLSRVAVVSRPAALMLFECAKRAERLGVHVVLLGPSPVVHERIEELGLTAALAAAGSREVGESTQARAARRSLSSGGAGPSA